MQQNPELLDYTSGRVNPTVETHIAFQVDDIEIAKRALDALSIPYIDMTQAPGNPNMAKQMFIRDPDGNLVEIAERTAS
jgi:catechol 2,3-dioxygenase-like lactoylglutathione lyase family enzyme